jgi:hypothetical protein
MNASVTSRLIDRQPQQGVRVLVAFAIAVFFAAACDRPDPTTPGSAEASASAATAVGSGEPEPVQAGDGSATQTAEQPSPGTALSDVPRVDLESLLLRAGYAAGDEIAVDEFVPVPPGAVANAATFGRDGLDARILVVSYPNPQYARPHVTDVLERRALLPTGGDAVLARGTEVIQLRMLDRAAADQLAEELRVLLQWPELVESRLLPPEQ